MEDWKKEIMKFTGQFLKPTPYLTVPGQSHWPKQQEFQLVQGMDQENLATSIGVSLNGLSARIHSQTKSYDEINGFIKNKEQLLACTPAIQPVSNKDLKRIASGFGYRVDPVYKTTKFHAGLDFAAPIGTPIYATANGTVETAGNTGNGYGNHVVIHNGYGYATLIWTYVQSESASGSES